MSEHTPEVGHSFEVPEAPTPETGLEKHLERGKEAPVDGDSYQKAYLSPVMTPPAQAAIDDGLADSTVSVPASPPTSVVMTADHADHIEKQWVDRAKAIIARTHDDPHGQKDQLSRVKADYLKQRFNKTVEAPETA